MPPNADPFGRADSCTLLIHADPVSIRTALGQIRALPAVAALRPRPRADVELALAEVLNNVAEHAYAGGGGQIAVTIAQHLQGLWCKVTDQGAPMPGGAVPEGGLPGAHPQPGNLPEGGFGWHLIRRLVRDLSYRREGRTNSLHFVIPLEDR